MIFYKFYPADYTADTMELTAEEDGIYLRLLNWYYTNEMPIPNARAPAIARATSEEQVTKTYWVLLRFFKQQERSGESVWTHARADVEISLAQKRIRASKQNGILGGRPRKEKPTGFHLANLDHNLDKRQSESDLLTRACARRGVSPSGSPSPRGSSKAGVTEEDPLLSSLPFVSTSEGSKTKRKNNRKLHESKSGATWSAYESAYEKRYGVKPTRNAAISKQLCTLVDYAGAEVAPQIASHYLTSNTQWYVTRGHPIDSLLKDWQKLRTEMITGRRMTQSRASEIDRQQSKGDKWQGVKKWNQERKEREDETELD